MGACPVCDRRIRQPFQVPILNPLNLEIAEGHPDFRDYRAGAIEVCSSWCASTLARWGGLRDHLDAQHQRWAMTTP